ncbi:hypothetical protein ACH5RR_015782 [Cinchona calisaya]|uniref:Uncharacterized protein n=1 Tax=Cinchona calisaya TaxID=153742 RepID=A0ABD2ZZI7_9GENT
MFEVNRNHEVIAIYLGEDVKDNNDVEDVNGINNDPLSPAEADEGKHHEEGIRGLQRLYCRQRKGTLQKKEVVSDDEVLNAAFNSSDDERSDEFLEFNAEKEIEKPKLVAGQLFSNVIKFREVVSHYSHTNHNDRGCKSIGCLYVRKRKLMQEQGAEGSNSQDIDIDSNPNIGRLDGGRDHGRGIGSRKNTSRKRGMRRRRGIRANYGPLCGIGNWNGQGSWRSHFYY